MDKQKFLHHGERFVLPQTVSVTHLCGRTSEKVFLFRGALWLGLRPCLSTALWARSHKHARDNTAQGKSPEEHEVSFWNRRDKAAQLNFQNTDRHIYITGVQVHSSHGSSHFSKEPSWYPSNLSAEVKSRNKNTTEFREEMCSFPKPTVLPVWGPLSPTK